MPSTPARPSPRPTGRPRPAGIPFPIPRLLIVAVLALLAIAAASAEQPADRTNFVATAVTPPPSLGPAVSPLSERQRRGIAGSDLDTIVATLRVELGIAKTPAGAGANGNEEADEPSVIAQRYFLEAREAWNQRQALETLRSLQAALRVEPRNPALLAMVGRVYAAAARDEQAITFLREAVRQAPGRVPDLLLLAKLVVGADNATTIEARTEREMVVWLADALDRMRTARSEQAASPDADADGDPAPDDPQAGDRDEDSLERDPDWVAVTIRFYLARALDNQGAVAAAARQYREFLDQTAKGLPGFAVGIHAAAMVTQRDRTWQRLGDLYHRLGQPREALAAYEQALDAGDTTRDELLFRLVYSDLVLNRPQQAVDRVRSLLAETGTNASDLGPVGIATRLTEYLKSQGVDTRALDRAVLGKAARSTNPTFWEAAIQSDRADLDAVLQAFAERWALGPAPRITGPEPAAAAAESGPAPQIVASPLPLPAWERLTDALLDAIARQSTNPSTAARHAVDLLVRGMEAAPHAGLSIVDRFARWSQRSGLKPALIDQLAPAPVEPSPNPSAARSLPRTALLAAIDDSAPIPSDPEADGPLAMTFAWLDARRALARGRAEAAIARLEPFDHAGDPRAVALLADAMEASGDLEGALAMVEASLTENRKDLHLLARKADLLFRLGQPAAAERTYLDAINIDPRAAWVYEALMDRLYDPVDGSVPTLPDATDRWGTLVARLLREAPESPEARTVRFEIAAAKRQQALANALIEPLLTQRPDYFPLWHAAADYFERTGQFEQLRDVLQSLVDRGQADADQWVKLAELYTLPQLGEVEPARISSLIERAMADPAIETHRIPWLFTLLGRAMARDGRLDELDGRIESAIERHPELAAELTYRRALLAYELGDADRGEALLLDVLARNPEHGPANNHLAYQWALEHRNLDRLLDMVNLALASDADEPGSQRGADNPAYLDTRGWIHYKLGEFDRAVIWLKRAVEQMRSRPNAVVLDHLGDAVYRLGDGEQAVRIWGRARSAMQGGSSPEGDPDAVGLEERLERKIVAVVQGRPADVAPTAEEAALAAGTAVPPPPRTPRESGEQAPADTGSQ